MSSESDLVLLADSIAQLQDELAQLPPGEDRTELEALLDLARETYTVVKGRLQKAPSPTPRRGSRAGQYRPSQYLQWH